MCHAAWAEYIGMPYETIRLPAWLKIQGLADYNLPLCLEIKLWVK